MEILSFIFRALLYTTGIAFLLYMIDAIVKAYIDSIEVRKHKKRLTKEVEKQIDKLLEKEGKNE